MQIHATSNRRNLNCTIQTPRNVNIALNNREPEISNDKDNHITDSKCNACKSTFSNQEELKEHYVSEHSHCFQCYATFKDSKKRCTVHVRCNACNATLSSQDKLKEHYELEHSDCLKCYDTFKKTSPVKCQNCTNEG